MIPKSRAVLSSGLRAGERRSIARGAHYAHLAASEDEALLRWRHARLLLDLLLDACDLYGRRREWRARAVAEASRRAHLVIGVDVELDLRGVRRTGGVSRALHAEKHGGCSRSTGLPPCQ